MNLAEGADKHINSLETTNETNEEKLIRVPLYRARADRLGPRLWDLTSATYDLARLRLGFTRKHAERLTSLIFDRMVHGVRGAGAEPLFVYLPVLSELNVPDSSLTVNEQYLSDYCARRNVPCLFLRQQFRTAIARGLQVDTTRHWDPAAHDVAATAIAGYLRTAGHGW